MRSRILLFTLLAALLASAPARAQVLIGYLFGEKLSTENFNMGFEVGVNFSNLDGFDGSEHATHSVFGLFGDWRFSEHFHLAGAVLPFAGRGAEGLDPVPTGDPAFDVPVAGATMTRSIGYVETPVLLKWAPQREEGFRIGAGPSFGWITSAKDRYLTATPAGMVFTQERDIDDQLPVLDFGLSVDAEWRLSFVAIAVRYTHGLTDLRHDGAPEAIYSRVLTGTGRIYLGKKPPP